MLQIAFEKIYDFVEKGGENWGSGMGKRGQIV
jgi:hypothetical protein